MTKKELMHKPSLRERKKHLTIGVSSCIICGHPSIVGNFTDYDGELKCETCGMPYYTEGNKVKPDELKRIYGLKPDDVARCYTPYFANYPILKRFWEETGQKIPLGVFDGSQPPYSEQEYTNLWLFIWKIRAELVPDWEEDFAWYNISVMAGEPLEIGV